MSNSASVDGYLHVEGFDQFGRDAFNKNKIRAGMRLAGRVVTRKAQMLLALSSSADDDESYPAKRTGRLIDSINFKVSRAGFLVRIAPFKTTEMASYYPAYLHYGVRQGRRIQPVEAGKKRRKRGQRQAELERRRNNAWRIKPHANYMEMALQDSRGDVQRILKDAFARALLN